jgi:RNA polymerase sigma-70 factor (ECF subfamily)
MATMADGRLSTGVEANLEGGLAVAVDRGRAAWPSLILDRQAFAQYLLARAQSADALASLTVEDLYLAFGCAQGDAAAVRAFVARLPQDAGAVIARIDPSPAFRDEVLQRLQVDLLVSVSGQPPAIAGYRGEGSLRSWIRAAAARRALALRGTAAQPVADRLEPWLSGELDFIKVKYREQINTVLEQELAALPRRTRSLLRLHYVDGLGIDQIGAIYHVSRATAARWIARERNALTERVHQRLYAKLRIEPDELDSLLRLVASGLRVSLERVLS